MRDIRNVYKSKIDKMHAITYRRSRIMWSPGKWQNLAKDNQCIGHIIYMDTQKDDDNDDDDCGYCDDGRRICWTENETESKKKVN